MKFMLHLSIEYIWDLQYMYLWLASSSNIGSRKFWQIWCFMLHMYSHSIKIYLLTIFYPSWFLFYDHYCTIQWVLIKTASMIVDKSLYIASRASALLSNILTYVPHSSVEIFAKLIFCIFHSYQQYHASLIFQWM